MIFRSQSFHVLYACLCRVDALVDDADVWHVSDVAWRGVSGSWLYVYVYV